MMNGFMASWAMGGIPLIGAACSLLVWSRPEQLRTWSVIVTLVSLATVVASSVYLTVPPEGLLLFYLLPVAACASLLGQPVHKDHRLSWLMTLLYLGLGLGALTSEQWLGPISLLLALGLTVLLLYRHHTELWPISWWGIGAYALAALCVVVAVVAPPPFASVTLLLVCAVLLPLVPFHDGHITALTRLPGSLPSFIALLFPGVGLHALGAVIPTVPDTVAWTINLFALIGILYGAVKALAQSRARLLLSYGSLSFYSMIWWFVASTRTTTPRAAIFIGAAGLATCGLLLAWQVIRTRYGDDVDPHSIRGLAATMPRYAVLVSFLALAAMGLPPFGPFAAFMGLLLSPALPFSTAIFVIVAAWLAASWYIMRMVQQWLFGMRRSDLRYVDLLRSESAALGMLVIVLLALGVLPATLFGPDTMTAVVNGVTELLVWNR